MSNAQASLILNSNENNIEMKGTLERIVFFSAESGYAVLKFKPEDVQISRISKEEFVTLVGTMPSPRVGSFISVTGKWVQHAKFGQQFQFHSFEEQRPDSLEGIRLFLGSGVIKGMRKRWADRIVEHFGMDTFKVLDNNPERLLEIPRLSKKLLQSVKDSWAEQTGIRELMVFLQPHGIGTALSVRLFKFYGNNAIDIIKENPYRMAMDVHGIGFLTADNFALDIGFEVDSPLRAQAATLYMLMRQSDEGNVYFPREELVNITSKQLNIQSELVDASIDVLQKEERAVVEDFHDHQGVYLSRFHHCESKISFYLQRLLLTPTAVYFKEAEKDIKKVIESLPIKLAENQEEAVYKATQSKIMVLTGGPGTGKTTIINAIIQVFAKSGAKILLAAPTGRAAKRMSETSGLEAKTIHRLLEYNPAEDGFAKNENNPLACTLLVIDEASMIDTVLMYHLVKAVPLGCTVIFVGDINQLPAVGAGNVLRDCIASGVLPVVELNIIYRQAAHSHIITNAHKINEGEIPSLYMDKSGKSDFYFFPEVDANSACKTIIEMVSKRIPKKFKFNPLQDIQVLSPMLKGPTGVNNLNEQLQKALNPIGDSLQRGEKTFRINDKVMQIKNNYDKDIYNGDIGIIVNVDLEDRCILVRFDERNVPYLFEELDELVLAYSISIHKSQGGEYPCVIIPLLRSHYVMLQRNLLYTAVTRGKKLVVIVGEVKAMAIAVHNNSIRKRYTRLAERLAGGDLTKLRQDMLPSQAVNPFIDDEFPTDDYTDMWIDEEE